MKNLSTEVECVRYLEEIRWGNILQCTYCCSKRSSAKKLRHTCLDFGSSYSVKVGTVFENSNLPLTPFFEKIIKKNSSKIKNIRQKLKNVLKIEKFVKN